ncbi:MAG: acyl carrier protein [Clostridiales bacterium]|nr:acyl carrier protein [Clostridiales bacterium]MDD7347668.1 acyl carrier protein [Clostridiales bacterium]MDY4061090.1 acyl carrier protein [Anaerovoracaceae bacterium]
MTLDKIKNKMVETLSVDEEKINLEAKLADDLGIDSLDAVELAMALEEEFDIKLSDDELQKLVTVKDIQDIVEKHLAK